MFLSRSVKRVPWHPLPSIAIACSRPAAAQLLPRRTMSSTVPWVPNRYPPARRTDHTEVYKSATRGDVRVPDPYVWLEDATAETEAWVDAQERFTRAYLDQLPDRERLEKAIRANTDYARVRGHGCCTARVCVLRMYAGSSLRRACGASSGTGTTTAACRPSPVRPPRAAPCAR
jgi:hypothetical protein